MLSTQNERTEVGTIRKTLCGNRSTRKKFIDMEYVYRELSKGRTRQEVADELDVHVNTLYNHHNRYQAQLQVLLKEREQENLQSKGSNVNSEIPPLPPEYR